MANDAWFGKGFEAGSYTPPPKQANAGSDLYGRGRFYIKVGDKKPIVFLDGLDTGMRFVEHFGIIDLTNHHPPTQFGQKHFFPCLHPMNKACWLCDAGCPSVRAIAMSIIDINGYMSRKDNTQVKNIKRLFIVYERELPFFMDKSKALSGLKASMFTVARYQKTGPTVGDDYTPVINEGQYVVSGKVTKKWVEDNKIDPKPMAYEEVIPFKMTSDEQKAMFQSNSNLTWDRARKEAAGGNQNDKAGAPVGGGGGGTPAGAGAPVGGTTQGQEDDIPF